MVAEGHDRCPSIPFKAMDSPGSAGRYQEFADRAILRGYAGWLTMLFGIVANGLSEHMPCLCKRPLCNCKVNSASPMLRQGTGTAQRSDGLFLLI